MAVLIQDLTTPYLSFVAHTVNPIPQTRTAKAIEQHFNNRPTSKRSNEASNNITLDSDPNDWVYVEFALGLGEILASGSVRGSPFSFLIHKRTGESASQ